MSETGLSRRGWLYGMSVAGYGALGLGHQSLNAEEPAPATPEETLAKRYRGNERFLKGESLPVNRDLDRVKQIAAKHTPFAAFLGCADSRVPIELIFDQGFGDLFVTRIAGNIATCENIGSLEFDSAVLGAKVIYVLGHSARGAVAATVRREAVPARSAAYFNTFALQNRMRRGTLKPLFART